MNEPLELIRQAMADRRISRGERKTLAALLRDSAPSKSQRNQLLRSAFEIALDSASRERDRELLEALYDVTKTVAAGGERPRRESRVAAYFSPRDSCTAKLRELILSTRSSIDVCVFTITDDRLSNALLEVHRRPQATVRIVTDDEKSLDRGSDIERLGRAGIPVRFDCSPEHMHHKFAVVDRRVVTTGSFNWTRSANERNQENVVVTDDPRLVVQFQDEFDRLWSEPGQ